MDQQLADTHKQLSGREQEIEALLLRAETEQRNTAALRDALTKNQKDSAALEKRLEELRAKHRDDLRRLATEQPQTAPIQQKVIV